MDDDSLIITLTAENGEDVNFEFLDLIALKGKEYVVLLPAEDEDADTVVILEVVDEGDGNESYIAVENERILSKVFKLFKQRNIDTFRFE